MTSWLHRLRKYRDSVTVTPYTDGSYDDDGIWSDGTGTARTINAIVEPIGLERDAGTNVYRSKGGLRAVGGIRLYVDEDEDIVPLVEGTRRGDRITHDGTEYRAVRMETWSDHRVVYAERVDDQ